MTDDELRDWISTGTPPPGTPNDLVQTFARILEERDQARMHVVKLELEIMKVAREYEKFVAAAYLKDEP